jgi:hypothetical protein
LEAFIYITIAKTIDDLLYKLPHQQAWCRKLREALGLNAHVDQQGKTKITGNLVLYEENYRRNEMPSELQRFSEYLWSLLDPYWFNASKVSGSKVFDGIEEGKLFLQHRDNARHLQNLCRLESALYKFIAYYCARHNKELNETKEDFKATKRKLDRANDEVKRLEVELAAAKHEIARIHEALWTAHTIDSLDVWWITT